MTRLVRCETILPVSGCTSAGYWVHIATVMPVTQTSDMCTTQYSAFVNLVLVHTKQRQASGSYYGAFYPWQSN